jgi:mannan polymerase II complex MNN10 subunit
MFPRPSKSIQQQSKRKPSRLWLSFFQQRPRTVALVVLTSVLFLRLVFPTVWWLYKHSRCSSVENGIVWAEGPAHSMQRQCPAVDYTTTTTIGKKPKICITTLTDASPSSTIVERWMRCRNFDAIYQKTWPNRQNYANKHGYTLVDGSDMLDRSRPPSWSKIRAVQRLFGWIENGSSVEEPCDWVFWMDADTVIMNSDIRLESMLPDNSDFLASQDTRRTVNAGAWMIRNSDWSRQFLQEWWNMDSFVNVAGLSTSGDNDAFNHLVEERLKQEDDGHTMQILVQPQCRFNSFGVFLTQQELRKGENWMKKQPWYMSDRYYHAGDFVAHAAGINRKDEGIDLLLQRAT